MKYAASRHPRCLFSFLGALLTLAIAGCAAPQATTLTQELPFEQAVAEATDGLVSQTQKLPAFLAKVESKLAKRAVVVDPMLDAGSGQQTQATELLEKRVSERLSSKYDQFELLPFQSNHLAKAQYLLTGTMTRAPRSGNKAGGLHLNLALTDLRSGNVVAQASALAQDKGLDHDPLPYYRDSPVLVKDKVIEGYVRTSTTAPGQRADAFYLERVSAASVINEATDLYNTGRYQDALGRYRSALATPAGEQLRVLNGIYLTNAKLGRANEAEQAFGRVVAMGIAYNELGVKFLFNPGSTEFWSDPKVSGPYGMWLRQIARESTAAKACMHIVGHTSRTGSEQTNETLSLQRAGYIKQRLTTEAAELGPRTKAVGMGARENIVGSGTDNAVDALDRRVAFKIVPCT
ncbi:OmpA family protein [Caldimonas brevitalea]|uniref:Flagellar motor protein MotB n=1 Tax=Caldimonas brevitalea TaxID=413882 RepID=A0A0G3BVT7_9BURK|nr:OmpA family protein [Caldimonas brevitalea]AKJ32143.1 flagellar motor protein MotB [Caldimonas brevitalea]